MFCTHINELKVKLCLIAPDKKSCSCIYCSSLHFSFYIFTNAFANCCNSQTQQWLSLRKCPSIFIIFLLFACLGVGCVCEGVGVCVCVCAPGLNTVCHTQESFFCLNNFWKLCKSVRVTRDTICSLLSLSLSLSNFPLFYTVRKVLVDFAVSNGWRYFNALCDLKFCQIGGNGRKFSHIGL